MKHSVGDSSSLRIQLLGKFQVFVDGEVVEETRWRRRSAKLLIKLLALRPSYTLHCEQIMESIWPESPPHAAANNLNKSIYTARRALEPDLRSGSESRFLQRESNLLVLRSPGDLWIDADMFAERASEALKANRIETYEEALTQYSGDLLEEDIYDEWLIPIRDKFESLYVNLTSKLAEQYQADGRYEDSIQRWNALISVEPTSESAHRCLMQLYSLTGYRQKALQQFQRCRDMLSVDLGLEPDQLTSTLYEEILAGRDQPPRRDIGISRDTPRTVIDSLAVLPFANVSGDPNLEYLCEGITEGLISNLALLPKLRVMARGSVSQYKGCDVDPQSVGRELKVRAVVLGKVSQWTERLIVGTELVHVADGTLLWGEQFSRPTSDIFSIQEDISTAILEKLKLKLTNPERVRLAKRHTENVEAYHHYLRGRFHWNKRTRAGLQKAIAYFKQAIEEDPAYALAYSGLADCYSLSSPYGILSPKQSMSNAIAAAEKALEIDETLAEAYTSLAFCKMSYEWDWDGAEECFRKALELRSNYATAHQWYHEYLTAMGRFEERVAHINKAKELDPLSLIIDTEAGWGMYFARQYDEAIRHLTETLETDDNFAVAHLILGMVFQQTQRFEEAIAEIEKAIDLHQGGPFTLAIGVLGHAYAKSGAPDLAREELKRLRELSQDNYVSAYSQALIQTGLEEHVAALDCLQKAFQERYDRMIFLNVEPMFDPLRSRPDFRQLIRQLGLH